VDSAGTVIVLAGGRGTRLQELTADTPKPLLPIRGRPFIEYIVLQLRGYGFRRFILASGYLADRLQSHFGSGRRLGVEIIHSVEQEPLGTAGALRLAAAHVTSERWLVVNGDTFFDADPRPVLESVIDNVVVSLAITPVTDDDRSGRVVQSATGRVEKFIPAGGQRGPGSVSVGVYGMSRRLVEWIPPAGPSSLEHDVLPDLVSRGLVAAVERRGYFVDIGLPASYHGLVADPSPLLAISAVAT
jgi:NDP-sugar pyrophosphorylase family protein